jgi:hypothetical protein
MSNQIRSFADYYQLDSSTIHPKVLDQFNDLVNEIFNYNPPKKSFFYKTGNYTSKLFRFLKRSETKSSVLLGHWAAETIVVLGAATAFYVSGNYATMMLLITLAAYGTYALFSLISNQKV